MKAKTIVILIVVALLCSSVASAGLFDWITGKAFSLKSIFQKSAAKDKAVSPAEQPAAVSPAEVSPTEISPTEFDSKPVAYKGDTLLVHVENRLRQMEHSLKMADERMGVKA